MANPSMNVSYLTLGLLIACTLIGIFIAARFRREVDVDLAPPTDQELLDPLEKAYYSGLMRPDEIERVRESIKKPRQIEPSITKSTTLAKLSHEVDPGDKDSTENSFDAEADQE